MTCSRIGISEHAGRRNLPDARRIELVMKDEARERERAKERQATSTGGSKPQLRANLPQAEKGKSRTTDRLAAKVFKEAPENLKDAMRRGELANGGKPVKDIEADAKAAGYAWRIVDIPPGANFRFPNSIFRVPPHPPEKFLEEVPLTTETMRDLFERLQISPGKPAIPLGADFLAVCPVCAKRDRRAWFIAPTLLLKPNGELVCDQGCRVDEILAAVGLKTPQNHTLDGQKEPFSDVKPAYSWAESQASVDAPGPEISDDAAEALRFVQRHGGTTSTRELQRKCWQLRKAGRAKAALAELAQVGRGAWQGRFFQLVDALGR